MSIHRFIESRATHFAPVACSRTCACSAGTMLARKRISLSFEACESFGSKCSKTLSCVSSVSRELRSQPYSPFQKKVLPPATCSTSSVLVPRVRRTAKASSSKSSPTGPTARISSKNDAARAKCVAAPPSIRSRSPNGVFTASKAMDPTTVTLIGGRGYRASQGDAGTVRGDANDACRATDRLRGARGAGGRGGPRAAAGAWGGPRGGHDRRDQLRGHPHAREHLRAGGEPASRPRCGGRGRPPGHGRARRRDDRRGGGIRAGRGGAEGPLLPRSPTASTTARRWPC